MKYDQLWAKANNPKYRHYYPMRILLREWQYCLDNPKVTMNYDIPNVRADIQELIEIIDSELESISDEK